MIGLLRERSTVLDSVTQPNSPSETASLNWSDVGSLAGLARMDHPGLWSDEPASATVHIDRYAIDSAFSSLPEEWEARQAFFGNYGAAPYNLMAPKGAIEVDSAALLYTEICQRIIVQPTLVFAEHGRLKSEGATDAEDSDLLWEGQLLRYLGQIIREATEQVFLDGMESTFSRQLSWAIKIFGYVAIQSIERVLTSGEGNAEVLGEILRQLGSVEDPLTQHGRLTILIDNLQAPDPRIRDAAALGIAALDDPTALSTVQTALDRETSPKLRNNLNLVIGQLQATKCQVSCG